MNPLAPYLWLIKLLAILAALGAAAWGVHALDQSRQQIGYDRRVAEDNVALIKATDDARERERLLNNKLETAQHDAITRDQDIRRHAAAAATAGDRLRIALDTLRRGVPGHPPGASPDPTGTLAELFGDCTDRYRGLAETADRHASDARTLSEAWPK